jgi:hypothetical protein
MIKRTFLIVGGMGLLAVVLFGRNACSYLTTSYDRVTTAVEDSVPVDFQIDRARGMVEDLAPEIRKSMHVIAKEEVELEKLNKQIEGRQDDVETDKDRILRLQSDLNSNRTTFRYAGRSYTADQVRTDLARRFNRFKVADDTLGNMVSMRDAREKNLDAARQQLSTLLSARQTLAVDLQNLEAKQKLVDVAKATSEFSFDDTRLNQAKQLISDIRTRLDVQAKLANADVDVQVEIQLDDESPTDITERVAAYFGLGSSPDSEVKTASYAKALEVD